MAVGGLAGPGSHRQGRPRRQPGGNRIVDQCLGKPGAAQRFEPLGGLQHDRAVGASSDHRLLLAHRAGGARGAAKVDAAAERAIEQGGRREQIGVAVALDDAFGKAGDDRALRDDAAGHAFEADRRFAGGHGNPPGLADQGIAVEPFQIGRRAGDALRIAIDGDRDPIRPGRGHDRLRRRARRRAATARQAGVTRRSCHRTQCRVWKVAVDHDGAIGRHRHPPEHLVGRLALAGQALRDDPGVVPAIVEARLEEIDGDRHRPRVGQRVAHPGLPIDALAQVVAGDGGGGAVAGDDAVAGGLRHWLSVIRSRLRPPAAP